jgi:hypothetical protein
MMTRSLHRIKILIDATLARFQPGGNQLAKTLNLLKKRKKEKEKEKGLFNKIRCDSRRLWLSSSCLDALGVLAPAASP